MTTKRDLERDLAYLKEEAARASDKVIRLREELEDAIRADYAAAKLVEDKSLELERLAPLAPTVLAFLGRALSGSHNFKARRLRANWRRGSYHGTREADMARALARLGFVTVAFASDEGTIVATDAGRTKHAEDTARAARKGKNKGA